MGGKPRKKRWFTGWGCDTHFYGGTWIGSAVGYIDAVAIPGEKQKRQYLAVGANGQCELFPLENLENAKAWVERKVRECDPAPRS